MYCFDQEAPPSEDDFDELVSCRPAFQVLKQLVQRCVSDVVSSGNVFADAILQHVYRWICRQVYDISLFYGKRSQHQVVVWFSSGLCIAAKQLSATAMGTDTVWIYRRPCFVPSYFFLVVFVCSSHTIEQKLIKCSSNQV